MTSAAGSYTLTRVPRADLVASIAGGLVLVLGLLGAPAEIVDDLQARRETIATVLVEAFGVLVLLGGAIRAAWYRRKISDPASVGDKGLTVKE